MIAQSNILRNHIERLGAALYRLRLKKLYEKKNSGGKGLINTKMIIMKDIKYFFL